jgi:thiosulfate/3-mercaptopyruvate sulfurtransferase
MLESFRGLKRGDCSGRSVSRTVEYHSSVAKLPTDTNTFNSRYLGTDPEPRPGLSSGHIPHSLSIPFTSFLQTHSSPHSSAKYTTYRTTAEIGQALVDAVGAIRLEQILKGERSIITSCGSGMTAGVLWLGLKLLGVRQVGLYDEVSAVYIHIHNFPYRLTAQSWTGYAARKSSVIEKSS